jgi:hypothetical protein
MANPTDTGWQDLAQPGQTPAAQSQPSVQPTSQTSAQSNQPAPAQLSNDGWTDLTKPEPTSTSVTQQQGEKPMIGAEGTWSEEKAGPKEEHPAAPHGLLRRAWDYANTPIADFVLPHGIKTADLVRAKTFESMFNEAYIPGINDFETKAEMHLGDSPTKAALKAFIAGSVHDTADVAAGFTSPLSVAALGAGKIAQIPGAVGKIAKVTGPLAGSAFTLQGAAQAVEGASDAFHRGLNAENASQIAGGAGQAILGGASLGHEVRARAGEVGQHLVNKAAPQIEESPMGAQVPTRSDTAVGRAVAAGAPEQAAQFAQNETAPAVQKAVGGTIGEAVGSNAETKITPEDRMGLKGHAHDLIENQARPAFKRVDELSGGELTQAQNKISSGWSQRDMEKVGQGESDKAALYDKYREKLKSEGMDVDDAERNYARGKAAERMAKRLDTATGPTNVEGAPYELNGKKLQKVVDDGIKNGSWSRMGLTEDHINELKSLAKTAATQTEIPKVNVMLKGLGKLAVAASGLHGGVIPALEAVSGVSAADYIGSKVSKHILQEAMTDFKATQALNDSVKTGNAQPVIDELSKNPSWVKRTTDYVTDLGKRLWKDESGELRFGKDSREIPADEMHEETLKNGGASETPISVQPARSYQYNPTGANNEHSVVTKNASGDKIGELVAQETGNVANRQVTVRSNQVYDAAERGKGHGKGQVMSLLQNVPDDVKAVKSDISTTKDAQRVWESLERQYPEAITKKVVGKGDSAKSVWTVDMNKFRSSGGTYMQKITHIWHPKTGLKKVE